MIVAVVVTYFPDFAALGKQLEALRPQVELVVVVDNASQENVSDWVNTAFAGTGGVRGVRLPENLGVAAAQNVGIRYARSVGATHVILFDQDSLPPAGMVDRLHAVATDLARRGIQIAAVGPRFFDPRRQSPIPFRKLEGLRMRVQECSESEMVEVDYLISSGCLIPLAAIDLVGEMNEALFIDYVDIEWGLRAQRAGLSSFGVCDVVMEHCLGDKPLKFLGRYVSQHPPLRRYYHFRNAVWLYRQRGLPGNWKVSDACRLMVRYGFYTLFSSPRLQQWQMMTQGIWHGLTGRMGRR